MSSTGSDWGGDYSFLLQSIEGKISENLTDKNAILSIPSPFLSSSSAVKRKRLSSDAIQSDLRDDMNTGSAAKMRDQAVIDELTLENEQLRDQLERVKSESSISRDELLRQVKFYEEKSDALKKESQTRLDKYYEEKKKWQIKQRETDTALKKAVTELQLLQQQQRTASSASSSTSAVVDSTQKSRQQQEMVSQRLRELDIELRSKVEESRMNQVAKLNMANELLAAQQELKQLRSTCGAGSMASEALQEARALRTQLSELESVHKRTARDHETMKKKFRNQTLLEEELSSVKAKLRIAEETNLAHRHVQVEHQQLVEEKALWSQMFQEVVAETKKGLTVSNSGGGVGNTSETGSADSKSLASALLADDESGSVQDALSSASATPTQVLHLLSAYQRRCALLLQGQGHLQHTVSELRRQLRHSQSQLQESEQLRAQSEEALDKAQAQLRNAQQQNKLYDGEIQSLRSLLRTFDTEFEIGRPNEAKMLSIKEKMIEDLRGELDKCRQQAEEYVSRLRCTEQESAQQLETISGLQTQLEQANSAVERLSTTTTTTTTTDVPGEVTKTKDSEEEEKMTVAALRADLEEARSDLMCIQHATGLDYIPANTRVLRLKNSLVSKVLPSSHPPYLVSTAASSNTTSSGGGTTPAAAAAASALPPRTTVPSVDAMQSIWKQLYLYLSNGGEANRSGSSSIDITSGDQNNNNNNNNNSNNDNNNSTSVGDTSATRSDDGGDANQSMNISLLATDNNNNGTSSNQQATHSTSTGISTGQKQPPSTSAMAADSNKLNQRLKEMFKDRITSFREGVYLLTGFKIDLYAAEANNSDSLPRLRLRSMYAEKPEDCLMFQLRGDAPELLDTEFASTLDPRLLTYLTTSNSVPAFLASVTLELFENQTFMG